MPYSNSKPPPKKKDPREYPEGKGPYAQRKRVTKKWNSANAAARRAMGLPVKPR